MSDNAQKALEIYQSQVGNSDGTGEWLAVEQDRINAFADATLDHQFIHIDPVKSAELSPYKVTIAHGFLTLSLVVHLGGSVPTANPAALEGIIMGVNYGLDKVRFPSPVPVNSKIRAERTLLGVEMKAPNTLQLKQQITVQIDGQDKPACVAEMLLRQIYG